jgi:hypothetical protein
MHEVSVRSALLYSLRYRVWNGVSVRSALLYSLRYRVWNGVSVRSALLYSLRYRTWQAQMREMRSLHLIIGVCSL